MRSNEKRAASDAWLTGNTKIHSFRFSLLSEPDNITAQF